MVKKLSRRDALKIGAIGLGGGLLASSPFAKNKLEDDMTIHIDSVGGPSYNIASTGFSLPHNVSGNTLHYPGLVVGVSIFGTGTVSSIVTESVTNPQNLIFIRADDDGPRRSEIWYVANLDLTGMTGDEFSINITLSSSVDVASGSCVYNYFGGIGFQGGVTGTTTPLAELDMSPVKLNSILFSNFCIDALTGSSVVDQYERWNTSDGISKYGFGSDYGPMETTGYIMSYQTSGVVAWALSGVELLDYQDAPPGIMGL